MVSTNTGMLFKYMRRKQNLASAIGIQTENWVTMHFSEVSESFNFEKKNRHALLCILMLSRMTFA